MQPFNFRRQATTVIAAALTLLVGACASRDAESPPPDAPGAPPGNGIAAQALPSPELSAMLRAELVRALALRGVKLDAQGRAVSIAGGKQVSSAPLPQYKAPLRNDDPLSGDSSLYWLHFMQGDYDSDGETEIADITPIALYYGKTDLDADWLSGPSMADGDLNGEVDVADITPIALNYGAVLGGYAVEAREAAGEWRDYGHMDFAQGFPSNGTLEFGYTAPQGMIEAEFRVRPVGQTRDFVWLTYNLTDSIESEAAIGLAIADGRPMLAYLSIDSTQASFAGFAIASKERPLSAADWYVEHKLLDNMDFPTMPALASVQGRPAMSYTRLDPTGTSENLYFNLRGSSAAGPDAWAEHMIIGPAPYSFATSLVVREGRPAVFYNGNGLKMFQAATSFPSSSGDWSGINCNPAFNDFRQPVVVSNGPYLFACGAVVSPSDHLVFSRSKGPFISQPSDFSEYLLWPGADSINPAGIALIGGIPCIACADYGQSAIQFLSAAGREVDSSANWFLHSVATTPGTDDFWTPTMALIEGRPAICAGYQSKFFHWTGGQWPDSADDWHHQPLAIGADNAPVAMVSAGGLPLLAYVTFEGGAANEIAIAVATEQ